MSTELAHEMSDTGSRIREERERMGLNQTDFAEIGGVSRNTQASYESGQRKADTDYLSKLSTAGVDVLYIITGQKTVVDLKPDEAALIDNYRHTPPERQHTVREVGAAFAKYDEAVKKAKGGN